MRKKTVLIVWAFSVVKKFFASTKIVFNNNYSLNVYTPLLVLSKFYAYPLPLSRGICDLKLSSILSKFIESSFFIIQ